jgi:hypothetical protein
VNIFHRPFAAETCQLVIISPTDLPLAASFLKTLVARLPQENLIRRFETLFRRRSQEAGEKMVELREEKKGKEMNMSDSSRK